MNSKINKYSLLLLFPALLFFSCAQEDMPGEAGGADDSRIVFRVSMAEEGSRATATTVTDINKSGFYVTAFCPEANVAGTLNPYFAEQEAKLLDTKSGYFGMFDEQSSEPEQWGWPSSRHSKEGRLKFFAFYPSCQELRQNAGVNSDYFRLENQSTKNGSAVTYNYQIKKFKVNNDITNHIDFVTATAEGTKLANATTGVKLAFEHQLSRIALKAWGNTPNDIEIAGVRIGWVITESDFNFAATYKNYKPGEDNTTHGDWVGTQTKECLEYIFQKGDVVVNIGNGNHTSSDDAASIMGKGELATVIPADYKGWNKGSDAPNKNKGIYFSVLLRVKENTEKKTLVYPYVIGGNISSTLPVDAMNVVFLSVKSDTGEVVNRVYRNKDSRKYYIDPGFETEYNLPEGEEIRNYGWAAIPLEDKRCKPGYHYTYTLDYSQGVGVHDPTDPLPGTPIIYKILVGVTEGQQTWPQVVDNFTSGGEMDITDDIIVE